MWNIKKITILLCFLSLVAFISCSAEDKTGSPKPEGETEITVETGSGSGTGESGSGGSGESGSGGGGETGETKITIPAIYHGTYTFGTQKWEGDKLKTEYYEGDTVVISADKIVLARPEAEPSSWANGTYYVSDATIYTNNKTMDTSIAGNLTGYPKSTVYLYNTNSSGKDRTIDFRLHHDEAKMNEIGVDIDTSSKGCQYFKKN